MSSSPVESAGPARLHLALASLLWSTGGTAIKLAGVGGAYVAAGRAGFAALALFVVLPEARRRPNARMLVTSALYAVTCALFVFANVHTTAASAIFIQNVAPVWVLLLGPWLTGERATRAELWSMPACIAGSACFFLDDAGGGKVTGNVLALMASLTYAFQISLYRKLSREEALAASVYGNIMVVLGVIPFAEPTELGLSFFLAILWLGFIQQALAVTLFVRGIQGTTALDAALMTLLEPVLAPIWAYLFLGETVGRFGILGSLLILGATVYRMQLSRRTS